MIRRESIGDRVLGLPLTQALALFEEGPAPTVVETCSPRGANAAGTARVLRYDPADHQLTVARFTDTARTGDAETIDRET